MKKYFLGIAAVLGIALILWTVVPLGLWLYYSLSEGRFIEMSVLSPLDLIIASIAGSLTGIGIAKGIEYFNVQNIDQYENSFPRSDTNTM